jgi:hypothetical protein
MGRRRLPGAVKVKQITVRIDDAVRASTVVSWIYEYLRRPVLLPPDPGPGRARLRLRLRAPVAAEFRRLAGSSLSSAVRRLIESYRRGA